MFNLDGSYIFKLVDNWNGEVLVIIYIIYIGKMSIFVIIIIFVDDVMVI